MTALPTANRPAPVGPNGLERTHLVDLMSEMWQHVLAKPVVPTDRTTIPGVDWLVGCVHITGAWRGTVTLAIPPQLARRIADRVHPEPAADAAPEPLAELVGELTNMLGGNLKALLPPPCYLSSPAVAVGDRFEPPGATRQRVVRAEFEEDGWPFVATLSETEVAAGGRRRTPERPPGVAAMDDCQASGRFPRSMIEREV